ncbi:MAG: sulfite exporter TauE/SafE family protein [Candidatus Nezhaarchaeota archaeon]|nr:sulfite exporter TauE/SafE family protein [Candidatus Nezhaarchaeota archaeon]
MKRTEALSFIIGAATGVAAGMVGVGGGEFRIPALVYLMGTSMTAVASSNLLIGLLTVTASLLLRLLLGLAGEASILYGAYLFLGSIPGAYVGAAVAGRASNVVLRLIVTAYLLVVGLRLALEPLVGEVREALLVQESLVPLCLAFLGFLISVVSAIFGVAGGEMRIPALIMLFGLGVKQAGTASLIASVATVSVGFLKHLRMGHFRAEFTRATLSMAVGSSLGALAGALLAARMYEQHLKLALGAILILATVRFVMRNR